MVTRRDGKKGRNRKEGKEENGVKRKVDGKMEYGKGRERERERSAIRCMALRTIINHVRVLASSTPGVPLL